VAGESLLRIAIRGGIRYILKKARAWRTVQVEQCLVDFQERYQQTALHFDGTFTLFDPQIIIGDHVCFSDGVHISSIASISIGSHTLFGSRIYVSDHNHGIYRGDTQSSPDEAPAHRLLGGGGPVVIGANVWIGDNSVIIGPATIGKGAIVGANSVVRGLWRGSCQYHRRRSAGKTHQDF
jgi:acetyltransferase-like isoleucine patch superfamily enzyme